MKKIVTLCCLALAFHATSAFAIGADLSAVACPGGAGAVADAGNLDCAGGAFLTLFVVFQPAEDAPDLTGIDVVLDMGVAGDLGGNGRFWDFQSTNFAALSNSHTRPATICNAYTNTWSLSGSGEGTLAEITGAQSQRIKALAYRPGPLAYTTNQKLFGMTFGIDASTSPEAGGAAGPGCTLPVCIYINAVFPRLVSGNATQDLTGPSEFGNMVLINGGTTSVCSFVLPTRKHTWGQLKSIYR